MKSWLLFIAISLCHAACGQAVNRRTPAADNDTVYQYRSPSTDGTGKFYMNREIAHIMDASGSDWLERSNRPEQENTDLIIASMKLTPDMVIADIGAGSGYYTFRMAPKVPNGKVYAVDIQQELIDMLNEKKQKNNVENVEVIHGDTLNVNLPSNTIDLAIMVDVYHELSWPKEIMRSIYTSLKPDGKMLLVEYRGEDPAVRIKPLHKTTVAQLSREMDSHGFVLERRVDAMPIQHFLVFTKKK